MMPRRSLLALLMLGAVAACDQPAATTATPAAVTGGNLSGTSWRIFSIAGTRVADMNVTRMAFDATTVTGSFGCNTFSAPYSTADGLLRVGAVTITEMGCSGAPARQERFGLRQLGFPMQIVPNGPSQVVLSGREGQSFILER